MEIFVAIVDRMENDYHTRLTRNHNQSYTESQKENLSFLSEMIDFVTFLFSISLIFNLATVLFHFIGKLFREKKTTFDNAKFWKTQKFSKKLWDS